MNNTAHSLFLFNAASAAGAFSLYALQKEPQLFDAVLAYSASVWWKVFETMPESTLRCQN